MQTIITFDFIQTLSADSDLYHYMSIIEPGYSATAEEFLKDPRWACSDKFWFLSNDIAGLKSLQRKIAYQIVHEELYVRISELIDHDLEGLFRVLDTYKDFLDNPKNEIALVMSQLTAMLLCKAHIENGCEFALECRMVGMLVSDRPETIGALVAILAAERQRTTKELFRHVQESI